MKIYNESKKINSKLYSEYKEEPIILNKKEKNLRKIQKNL